MFFLVVSKFDVQASCSVILSRDKMKGSLKNHAKCIGMGWGIREVTASINFRSIPTMSLRGPVLTLTAEPRSGEFDGTGWTGWTGRTVTKSVLQFSS